MAAKKSTPRKARPTRTPAPKLRLEQLMTRAWDSKSAAVNELKANGFPAKGDGWSLKQTGNMWGIDVIAPDIDSIAGGQDAPSLPEAKDPAPPPEPEPAAEPPSPAPGPTPPIGCDARTPLPDDGPWAVIVGAEVIRQNGVIAHALDISRFLGQPVVVARYFGPGNYHPERTLDHKTWRQWTKSLGGGSGRASVGVKGPRDDSKAARATALLVRPDGATAVELLAVTGWTVTDRHIRRLALRAGVGWKNHGDRWTIDLPKAD